MKVPFTHRQGLRVQRHRLEHDGCTPDGICLRAEMTGRDGAISPGSTANSGGSLIRSSPGRLLTPMRELAGRPLPC